MTKNFSKKEFECKCGCEMPDEVLHNVVKLATQLQRLRDHVNKPIKINSSFRCEAHNRKVGGSLNSQHKLGKAADIVIKDMKPYEVFILIEDLIDAGELLQGGVGNYSSFTHYDIRKHKARWNYA